MLANCQYSFILNIPLYFIPLISFDASMALVVGMTRGVVSLLTFSWETSWNHTFLGLWFEMLFCSLRSLVFVITWRMIWTDSHNLTHIKWTISKLPHLLTYIEKYICQEDRWWRYASSGQNVPFSQEAKLTRSQIITRRWLNDHAIWTRKVHSMFNGIRPYPEIAVFTLYIISVTEIESVFVRIFCLLEK